MKLSEIAHDVQKGEKGVWIESVIGNVDLKVADGDNKLYFNRLKELATPYRHSGKNVPDEKWEEIINQALAEHVLLDWRNLEDDSGNAIVYSKQKAYEILKNPEYKELRKVVMRLSEDQDLFRKQGVAAIANKSK